MQQKLPITLHIIRIADFFLKGYVLLLRNINIITIALNINKPINHPTNTLSKFSKLSGCRQRILSPLSSVGVIGGFDCF